MSSASAVRNRHVTVSAHVNMFKRGLALEHLNILRHLSILESTAYHRVAHLNLLHNTLGLINYLIIPILLLLSLSNNNYLIILVRLLRLIFLEFPQHILVLGVNH